MGRPSRTRLGALAGAAALALLAGCGGGKAESGSASASATAPEDKRVSAAEVATGLHRIDDIVRQVAGAAGTDKAKAADLTEQIEPVWQEVEGTIKANDQDAYIKFEDDFAQLEKAAREGDGSRASRAATDVSSTVASYLARYPG